MKSALLAVLLFSTTAFAAPTVIIKNEPLGDGPPDQNVTIGGTIAHYWGDGLYEVPGYMPGYPTASVLWPRVVSVPCVQQSDGVLECKGYEIQDQQWNHRGEYILFRPHLIPPLAPPVVNNYSTTVIKEQPACNAPLPVVKQRIRQ